MSLSAGGFDNQNQLGINPTSINKDGRGCVYAVTSVPFDLEGVQCVSGGFSQSVIIKRGRVFAAGYDEDFIIGSSKRTTYKTFTEIKISDEPIIWAACGSDFTIYQTISGKAILCHSKAKGERILVPLAKKAISVFAGILYGGIIDEEGAIHILDKKDPHKPPIRVVFTQAVDLACCERFTCVLMSDGRVYANRILNNDSLNFIEVASLKNQNIIKLSGYRNTCAALSSDGCVFMCGKNDFGQFGDGTTNDNFEAFIKIKLDEEIVDVSCSLHTLFITKSNKILGCGINNSGQLFKKTNDFRILSPIYIDTIKADHVIACSTHSFILSWTGKLENPKIKKFKEKLANNEKSEDKTIFINDYQVNPQIEESNRNTIEFQINEIDEIRKQENETENLLLLKRIEEQNIEQREKIDSLILLCQAQSESIAQLTDLCTSLQQQSELNKKEIQSIRRSNKKELLEIKETQSKHSHKIHQLGKDLKAHNEEVNTKLDSVVQYVKDQDQF